jgi:GT2 family glycosyltransferase
VNHVIMPFLNNWDQTRVAIDDVLAQSIPVRLLLVNQGSDDDARRAAQDFTVKNLDRVRLWNYDPALPLAACWNKALRSVWQQGAEHAWVVNNDVRLWKETYKTLLDVQQASNAWFVTGVGVTEREFEHFADEDNARTGLMYLDAPDARGGPDFSCFVITGECHRYFQFDEAFIPAYHEDNDYHRRLQLAGLGDKIFGVNLPFLHYGSGTLKANETLREGWGPRFAACQQYYIQKWGGLPGSETYGVPFEGAVDRNVFDACRLVYGQGKGDYVGPLYA